MVHLAALHGLEGEAAEATRRVFPKPLDRKAAGTRAILDREVIQIPDYQLDPDYGYKPAATMANVRSALAVPMIRDGVAIGAIVSWIDCKRVAIRRAR